MMSRDPGNATVGAAAGGKSDDTVCSRDPAVRLRQPFAEPLRGRAERVVAKKSNNPVSAFVLV